MPRRLVGFFLGVALMLLGLTQPVCTQGGGPTSTPAAAGQTGQSLPVNLLEGARWQYSIDEGETWTARPPIIPFDEAELVLARASFKVIDPSVFAALELTHGMPPRHIMQFTLNGRRVPLPLAGMYYKTIPAIPATMLKREGNSLTARVAYDNRIYDKYRAPGPVEVALPTELLALRPEDLKIITGPILGSAGTDHFTATLRTNLPAEAELYYGPADAAAPYSRHMPGTNIKGLYHRFKVAGLKPGQKYGFYCVARAGKDGKAKAQSAYGEAHTLPEGDRLRFAAMGDSRTFRQDWAQVAAAVAREATDLVVFSGDMTDSGREDWRWNEHFFGPAKDLFATVPFYAVMGNHEENAPVYPPLFNTPGGDGTAKNWSQEVAGVLLVGINGRAWWTPDTANYRWLEGVLKGSQARFIFLFSHYPGWTSGVYGGADPGSGRSWFWEVRQARENVIPLLQKYNATAMIAGHDHLYERSELPGGKDADGEAGGPLTLIISARAGAPSRKDEWESLKDQNPYSKVLTDDLNYCVFEVAGETCAMKALTPEGNQIDTRTWKARKPP